MASNNQGNKKTKAQQREAALAEAARIKSEQTARTRRHMLFGIGGGIIAVVIIVVVVLVIVMKPAPNLSKIADKPNGWTSNGGITVGKNGVAGGSATSGDVTVEIWSDYMCSYCDQFENAYSQQLTSLVDDGQVNLVIHALAFLDNQSKGTKYSTRSAAAAAAVAKYSPDQYMAFHDALYQNYPGEGTTGLTDAKLQSIAKGVGVNQQAIDQFTGKEFNAWVSSATNYAMDQDKITGTPIIKLVSPSGQVFKWTTYNASGTGLNQAIAKVKAGQDPNS